MLSLGLRRFPDYFCHCLRPLNDSCCGGSVKGHYGKGQQGKGPEASLNEKTLELNATEQRATTIEKARELAEQKAEGL